VPRPLGTCKTALRLLLATQCVLAGFAMAQNPKDSLAEDLKFEIRRYLFEGSSVVPGAALEEATAPYTGKDRTFGDVQRALEAIEKVYAEKGYSAIRVTLPEQVLERGEVRFEIAEARVGQILVQGNKFFSRENIVASLPGVKPGTVPNIRDMARDLRLANENPAKQTNVLLRAQDEKIVDVLVRVADEPTSRWSVSSDNTGTKETGHFRIGLGYRNSNMFDTDQVLTLAWVGAPYGNTDPKHFTPVPSSDVFIVGASYRIPLYELGDAIDISGGYSNVNSGTVGNLFSISGAGGVGALRYTKNLDKIGNYEHRFVFAWDYRGYQNKGVRAEGGTTQIVRDYTVHPVSATYLGQMRWQSGESTFSVGVSRNIPGGNDATTTDFCGPLTIDGVTPVPAVRTGGSGKCAGAHYSVFRGALSHIQQFPGDWQGRLAMNGQLTSDMLAPGEQFGLGGADSVRGFLEREISNDKGYRGTVELYTPDFGGALGVAGVRMRGLFFTDWGGLRRNDPAPGEVRTQHIRSAGVGMRLWLGADTTLRMDLARVLEGDGIRPDGSQRVSMSFTHVF